MEEHDLSTPDGFAQHMREKEAQARGEVEEPAEPGAPEAPEEEAPEAPPEEEPAGPQPEDVTDAEERGYMRALGEQSEKLGEERARREAAEAYIATLQEQAQAPPPTEAITDETWERLEGMYANQGGAGMMIALANDPAASEDLIDAGIALWKENDYRNAELYEKRMNRYMAETLQEEPGLDPDVAELKSQAANAQAVATLTAEYGKERLEAIQPHLEEALKSMPPSVQKALGEDFQSADKDRIVGAFRALATLTEPALEGQGAARKQAATVGSGSQSRVSSGQSELPSTQEELDALGAPDSPERKIAASKLMGARIMAQQTSVAEELAKSDGPK